LISARRVSIERCLGDFMGDLLTRHAKDHIRMSGAPDSQGLA
jgi:hypothetical protein